jgi:hypothetical protein
MIKELKTSGPHWYPPITYGPTDLYGTSIFSDITGTLSSNYLTS